ncbi:MAG: M20/M25/M40 family metallo-hydrolase, partial [Planctomycetaceae bacterium]|nr:M20/M25/M40 family metallo-hydrolase [Planctomycetaceae bacterium]
MIQPVDLVSELIRFESTSSLSNAEISGYLVDLFPRLDFEVEQVEYESPPGVRKVNVIAKKGKGTGGVAYFGHSDVVPADNWKFAEHGPYQPTIRDGMLYGRGSCDMKGSVAAFMAAAQSFTSASLKQPIYIAITADEEVGFLGAEQVQKRSVLFREMVAGQSRGIIGEPTELNVVYAHKGAYGFRAIARGRAAHSSTNRGINANLAMIPFLVEMKRIHDETLVDPQWLNQEFNPPGISWNIGINDFTRAVNITPPQSICTVYFRPMPGMDPEILLDRARSLAESHGLEFIVMGRGPAVYVDPHSDF